MIDYQKGDISLWEFIKTEKSSIFIVFGIVLAIDLVTMAVLFPFVCVRSCGSACKRDITRSDYRKADKVRPGVWYLALALVYLGISLWSIYFACSMYTSVRESLCQSANFVDTVNLG